MSGTVIGIENQEPDIEPHCEQFTSSSGNYVVIQIDDTKTYLILAHLKKNSITIRNHSHVTKGTVIGKVGNSGTTTEPHLHIQHQRKNPLQMPFPICAEGLPITFEKEVKEQ